MLKLARPRLGSASKRCPTPRVLPSSLRPLTSTSSSLHASSSSTSTTNTTNTINASEIAHFTSLSEHWWDPLGEFTYLHRMNPSRTAFLHRTLLRSYPSSSLPPSGNPGKWLEGKDVLDVGCGGGIFSEALARLGGRVTGVDAAEANIKVAETHRALDKGLEGVLEYRWAAAEDLVREGRTFDVVCAMEVVEHVDDPRGFLECLRKLVKPGGHLILSTISRTPLAQLLTITLAERVLRLVTPETHHYDKYLKPEELAAYFKEDEVAWGDVDIAGCVFMPGVFGGQWKLLGKGEYGGLGEMVNYFVGVRKPLE